MPNNILKDFFYGNINPKEKQFDRNSEYGKAAAGLADEEEKLRSMLNQEAATVLDKMICLQAAIAGMTAEEYFIDGLRTGFRLALALLQHFYFFGYIIFFKKKTIDQSNGKDRKQ